jgi:hypothetical protein
MRAANYWLAWPHPNQALTTTAYTATAALPLYTSRNLDIILVIGLLCRVQCAV